jgi:hypothetical protein
LPNVPALQLNLLDLAGHRLKHRWDENRRQPRRSY